MELRHLLLIRKAVTNLDSILKSRDRSLPTKVLLVKAVVFPGVMYGCASWTIKKAEHRRTGALKLWCWRRLLRVPWTAVSVHPKGVQLWIFIGRTEAEAEAPTLWPPDAKSWLTGKGPDAGEDWRQEEKWATEDETAGCITDSTDLSLSELQETVKEREVCCAAVHGVSRVTHDS